MLLQLGVSPNSAGVREVAKKYGVSLPHRNTLTPLVNNKRLFSYAPCAKVLMTINAEASAQGFQAASPQDAILGCEWYIKGLSNYLADLDLAEVAASSGVPEQWITDMAKSRKKRKRVPYHVAEKVSIALFGLSPRFGRTYPVPQNAIRNKFDPDWGVEITGITPSILHS